MLSANFGDIFGDKTDMAANMWAGEFAGVVKRLACVHKICTVHENVNRLHNVNIDNLPHPEVERMFVARLRALLAEVFPKTAVDVVPLSGRDQGVDFVASVQVPNGPRLELLVEYKLQPRPSLVHESPRAAAIPAVSITREFNADQKVRRVQAWIYAAPFVSSRLAEVCWDKGWGWFDLAGNCRISVPGLLYLDRRGYKPIHSASRPEVNLGTPEASRILRVLLNSHTGSRRWRSQRELQQAIQPGVSLGLVNKIVAHLRSEGYLAADEGGGLHVTDPEKLLFAWRDAYRCDRLHRLELFTLLKVPEIERVIREVNLDNPPSLAWAVFSAAERQAPMVRQPRLWLMSSGEDMESLRERFQAKVVDTGANLTLLTAPDRGYLEGADSGAALAPCTSPLQTYLDTWHAGGRGQEAAEAILEQRLRPMWKQHSIV